MESSIVASDGLQLANKPSVYAIYEKWPEYFENALSTPICSIDRGAEFYHSVVLCGMGASATACDIIQEVMSRNSRVPCVAVNRHDVPRFVDKHSLVIVNSVSGNTQEALSMMRSAAATGAEVFCISSGGQLRELSTKYNAKHIEIPNLLIPRATLPYLTIPGLRLIQPLLDIQLEDMSQICSGLAQIKETISFGAPEDVNIAKKISRFLRNGIGFCFASPYLHSAGKRFKNSLNENAKQFCYKESMLEASHNEIVPFTFDYTSDYKVLFLRWTEDDPIIKQRFEKVDRLMKELGQSTMELYRDEPSLLGAILSAIYILDYSTLYSALSRGVDPSPTPAIEILKDLGH